MDKHKPTTEHQPNGPKTLIAPGAVRMVRALRLRIEQALQASPLLLCFDNGRHLWPFTNYRDAQPQRVDWLMQALVNYQVPVVLLTTPQFFVDKRRIEIRSGWDSSEFVTRLRKTVTLAPEQLSKDDLEAVARHMLPEATDKGAKALVAMASVSAKHLVAIGDIVVAARSYAETEGRTKVVAEDIRKAIADVSSSARALAALEGEAAIVRPRRGRRASLAHEETGPGIVAEEPAALRRDIGSSLADAPPSARRGAAVPSPATVESKLSVRSEPVRAPDPFEV